MTTHPDFTIVIPAAGSGDRLGLGPKAWLTLGKKSLLSCLVAKARSITNSVIIAAPAGCSERLATLCPECLIIEGGATRQQTVKILAQACKSPWLIIQDAARPFVSTSLLRSVADATKKTGAAGAFLAPEVPVAIINKGLVTSQFPADEVGIFQAPQGFSRHILDRSISAAEAGNWVAQSTIQLVLQAGYKVQSVPGEKTNIKLTTPADWLLAQSLEKLL